MDPPTSSAEDYDAIVQRLSVNQSSASANAAMLDATYAEYSLLPLGEPDFATYYPFGDPSINPFDYIGSANFKTPYLELGDWSASAPTGPAINNDLGFDITDSLRDEVYPPAVSKGKLDKRTLKMIIRDTCHTLVNAHPEEHVTFDSGGRKHRYTSFTLPQHSGEDTDNQELYSPDFTKTAKHDSNRPFIKAVVKAVCEVEAPSTCDQLRSIVMAKTEAYFRQMMRNFAKQNSRISSRNKENLQA